MEDRMLDLPEEKRSSIEKALYVDRKATNYNPTILPDRLLKTLAPVFMIRHPAKQIESWYRVSRIFGLPIEDPDFELCVTYKFSRRLFEYVTELYQTESKAHQNGNGVHTNGNGVYINGNGVHLNGTGVRVNGNGAYTNGNGAHTNGNGAHTN
jgi:hypothetical protein